MIHIYAEKMQPATSWVDNHSTVPLHLGFAPDKPIPAICCGEMRPAKDCVVQCYYDWTAIWCAPDKGCKDPKKIAEKKALEFANRSAGQKARWAKRRLV